MNKLRILLIILLFCSELQAQKLDNCALCSTKKYSETDIKNNDLKEIMLLRNEIFARHNYAFENDRLTEHFSEYSWYEADRSKTKTISLNTVEQSNVDLFKLVEEKIWKDRSIMLKELKSFKSALINNDTEHIKSVFNGELKKDGSSYYDEIVNAMNAVLSSVNLESMNWHGNQALYQVQTDNGFSVSLKRIDIINREITITKSDPMQHSELLKEEAFDYPSEYYSESENTIGAVFNIKNGKLVLIRSYLAG